MTTLFQPCAAAGVWGSTTKRLIRSQWIKAMICPVCGTEAELTKSLGEAAKVATVLAVGSWLAQSFSNAGVGLGTATSLRCCRPCFDRYAAKVKPLITAFRGRHQLIHDKYPRVGNNSSITVNHVLRHGQKTLVGTAL